MAGKALGSLESIEDWLGEEGIERVLVAETWLDVLDPNSLVTTAELVEDA